MIFIGASNEPTMMILLTDQDVADMRGGRTKFVDNRATKGFKFDKVVLSVHKNQAEIEDLLRQAGHGALLQGMTSHEAKPPEATCDGCKGIMPAPLLFKGKCHACWCESAEAYRRMWLEAVGATEPCKHDFGGKLGGPCLKCGKRSGEILDPEKTVATKQEQEAFAKELEAVFANARKCTKCGRAMYHTRLGGYRCHLCN